MLNMCSLGTLVSIHSKLLLLKTFFFFFLIFWHWKSGEGCCLDLGCICGFEGHFCEKYPRYLLPENVSVWSVLGRIRYKLEIISRRVCCVKILVYLSSYKRRVNSGLVENQGLPFR